MPKITNFVFCEPGNFEDSLPRVTFIEAVETSTDRFGFAVLYSIAGFPPHVDHTGFTRLSGPNDEKLVETDKFTIESEGTPTETESEIVSGITMGVEFGDIEFKGAGLYKVELFFDDELLSDFSIPVFFKKESEQK